MSGGYISKKLIAKAKELVEKAGEVETAKEAKVIKQYIKALIEATVDQQPKLLRTASNKKPRDLDSDSPTKFVNQTPKPFSMQTPTFEGAQ